MPITSTELDEMWDEINERLDEDFEEIKVEFDRLDAEGFFSKPDPERAL
jgi:threonyl-tRNA synthetase